MIEYLNGRGRSLEDDANVDLLSTIVHFESFSRHSGNDSLDKMKEIFVPVETVIVTRRH